MGAEQKLIFKPVMEALFIGGLGDRMTGDFRAQLLKLGVDVQKLLPGYDYVVYERAVLDAVSLFPELDRPAALTELGRRMVQATIDASPVGKSLMPVLKLLGMVRAMKRSLSRGASENFNLVTFGAESPQSLEVIMSFVGKIPEFALGTLTGLATALGAKDVRGRVLRYEREAATYLIEWS